MEGMGLNYDDNMKKMVNENINLIYKPVANYYYSNATVRRNYEFDELLSVATLGLYKAASKFDKSKGCEFSTYAVTIIRYSLLQFTRNDKWHYKRTVKDGIETFDRIKRVSTSTVVSSPTDKTLTIEDRLEDKEEYYKGIEDKQLVETLLSTCIDRERRILEGYFYDKKPQSQLSKEFKTSQSFISLVIKRNLKRFKEILEKEEV